MSIEVENREGDAVVKFTRTPRAGYVDMTVDLLDGDAGANVWNLPIRDLLIALHALSGQPVAPEPAKPVRPKYRPVSEWFRRRRKD